MRMYIRKYLGAIKSEEIEILANPSEKVIALFKF